MELLGNYYISSIFYVVVLLISLPFVRRYFRNKGILFLFLSILPLSLLAAFRIGAGVDTKNYIDIYNYVGKNFNIKMIFTFYQEPFNVIIYYFSYMVFKTHIGMLFIYSFLTSLFVVLGIKKFEDRLNPTVSFFIYFVTLYFISFNIIRQVLAISIVFYCFKDLLKKRYIKYLFFVVLASLFHESAIAMLFLIPLVILANKNISVVYVLIIIGTVMILVYPEIIYTLLRTVGVYDGYIDKEYKLSFGFLLYRSPMITFALVNKDRGKEYRLLLLFYFLSIPLQLMGMVIAYANRLSIYVTTSEVILISIIYRNLKEKNNKYRFIIPFWYSFYYVVMIIMLNANQVLPYFQ